MNKYFFILLVLLSNADASAQNALKMTLKDAIDYAMKNQPAYQNYRVDQQIASSRDLQAVSGYLPKISGTFDLRDNLKLPVVALKFPNPLTGVDEELNIQQGTKYQGTASLDLSQTLIDPSLISDLKYYKEAEKVSDLAMQQATIDLKINVSRAYYLALLNVERAKKETKTVERDQKAYDDTKVKYENQNALKSDLNRAYLNLQNSKYQLKVFQDSIQNSSANLAQLIGLPLDSKIELADSFGMAIKAPNLPEYPDFKSAEENRLELKSENTQQNLNTLGLHKINYAYFPTLSAYASYGGLGLDNSNLFRSSSWYQSSYIGIRLSVPIFDGLTKMAQAQQQKLLVTKNRNNLNSIRQTINYQLRITSVNYANAYQNLQLISENVKLAEDVVSEVNVRYQNSMATYQEVLDSENTLKDTEFNYLQALCTFLLADLDWRKANGKL